jgi:GNAT superfamily N-acetyltransferase
MAVTLQQAPQPVRLQVAFRVIHDADRAFLLRVYASTREWEFRLTVWTEADKADFLRRQFEMQDRDYQQAFPAAVRRIVTLDGVDIGRLYVQRQDDCLRIIEFSLLPEARGRGIGTDILRSLLNEAHGGKVPVRLSVARGSPALRLYARHGFRVVGQAGHHLALEWRPDLGPREV